jgi:peptidoglycan/LPS O-acetylase OafA/YrhL
VLGLTVLAAMAGHWPSWLSATVGVSGAVIAALIAYRLIERPFMGKPAGQTPEGRTAAAAAE